MKTIYPAITQFKSWFILLTLGVFITSCGSFQGASYNDGIYSEDRNQNQPQEQVVEEEVVSYEDDSAGYYKALFNQKAAQYDISPVQEDSIFTDVDSYSSQSYNQSNPDYTSSYGGGGSPWGENPTQIHINYYDNGWGWNNWGWGGFGWNRWVWNRWGWNNWGWNAGWGLGWRWNRPWGWNNWGWYAGWGSGWGWNNWGWYGRNNIAFANGNRAFRGNYLGNRANARNSQGRSAIRRNVGRSIDGSSRGNRTISRRSASRNSRATSRRSSSRNSSINRGSRTSRNSSMHSNRSSRSNRSSTMRSSRGSSRSSGMRSSGGSRSRGGMRSGGGRSGGRRR